MKPTAAQLRRCLARLCKTWTERMIKPDDLKACDNAWKAHSAAQRLLARYPAARAKRLIARKP